MEFKRNVILAKYSNYKIGGPAKVFFEAKNIDEVKWAVEEARKQKLKIFILGGGTNLLISDDGYDGLVLKVSINFLERNGDEIKAGAGTSITQLLNYSIAHSLSGLEWAGGLPGTLGGAIRGNAGCFGGEIKDNIKEIESFDIESGERYKRNNKECEFGYRNSVFKELGGRPARQSPDGARRLAGGEIILSATFNLKSGDSAEIRKSILSKIEYRKSKQPLEYPNIGSIFKNVPVGLVPKDILEKCADVIKDDPFPIVPAARLITLAGLKGTCSGGAMISPKHGNFIVNVGNAKAEDVKNLIKLIKEEIGKKFGIKLEEEITEI